MRTAIETPNLSLSISLMRDLQQMPELAPSLQDPRPAISDQGPEKIYNAPNFGTNVVIIMAGLFLILACALGINPLVRCALRWTRRIAFQSPEELGVRRANTGMKKNVVKALPTLVYSNARSGAQNLSVCPICLGEFADGEHVRVLPNCRHSFHMNCIDTWLVCHSSCPTCRHILLSAPESKSTSSLYGIQHASVRGLRLPYYGTEDSPCQESCAERIPSGALVGDDLPPVFAGGVESPSLHVVEIAGGTDALHP